MDPHGFDGRDIPYVRLDPDMTISDLVEVYAASGYNGRSLGEAAKLYLEMIRSGATICLTMSGALSPVGLGGVVRSLIERGFVDWIITTGANVYHEDHFAWGLPIKQGTHAADDTTLFKNDIVRIRDVYIRFSTIRWRRRTRWCRSTLRMPCPSRSPRPSSATTWAA